MGDEDEKGGADETGKRVQLAALRARYRMPHRPFLFPLALGLLLRSKLPS